MSGLLAAVHRADRQARHRVAEPPLAAAQRPLGVAELPGLVPYKTTQKSPIELVPSMERIRRLRKRLRWTAKSIIATAPSGFIVKPAMLTLTYEQGDAWNPCHVRELLDHVRKYLKRKHDASCRYIWVAELQDRGAVHYHVIFWLPRGVTLPKPDKQGWWPHGSTRIEWVKSAVGYVTKYATKFNGKDAEFPPGIRLHGSGGVTKRERSLRGYLALPEWCRNQVNPAFGARPVKGGGYVDCETGEILVSPWIIDRFTFRPGVGWIVHVRPRSETT
ncbi:MAG: rolling circle replication-associated protein [Panacagrimonas sp.]